MFITGNTSHSDIDILTELTEAITYRILIIYDSDLSRPSSDKIPILSYSSLDNKVINEKEQFFDNSILFNLGQVFM